MDLRPRILIVDDDPRITSSIKAVLYGKEYEIEITNNPNIALKHLNTGTFDLAILDVMMPGMSGFQIMEELDRGNLETLFIIITGEASIESAVEAVRKGASDYLRKPFEPDELILRVEKVLKQKQLNDERKEIEAEKKTLENQLRQSQKMEAIGTLAGGIAHDFNNMLGIIIGSAELAMETLPLKNPVKTHIDKILQASMRAEEMITRLLSFSRESDLEKKPIILNTIVKEALKLLRSSIPANIEIRENIPDVPLTILGNPTQIDQILLNLCTNAAHAMQQSGGILEVQLEKKILDKNGNICYGGLEPGTYCMLTVADTGHGIDPAIIDRIFEPYFTTKDVGKGTGMGLSVVHGIVKNHLGDIKIHSEPGEGTLFHIYLPFVDAIASDAVTVSRDMPPKGKERILLVDDEQMIVDIMKEMLEKLGYKVLGLNNSNDALEEFYLHPEKYDLVITDMSMPSMTGERLALKLKEIREDIPVIICTGFNETINRERSKIYGIQEFVMKPVSANKLAQAIRRVLDARFYERRRKKRFLTRGDSFVVSNSKNPKRFSIIDISESGLAFKYPMAEDPVEIVSISTKDEEFIMENIKYKTVSDIEINGSSSILDAQMRRCGIQFEALTPSQIKQLGYFINNYTDRPINQDSSKMIQ